jgi:RNA polymerase sigma-70 factor (ECF subfamily)
MKAADEQQLIIRVREGDHDAFRLLVERYMKFAYNIAYGFVGDHDDAEDVAQESFVKVYEAIKSFRGESTFNTWLYRIVTNLSLNRVRQKKISITNMSIVENSPTQSVDFFRVQHAEESRAIIEKALHELPTLQRAVLILRHFNGLSTRQVGEILRCSEGTVKTHLHRGILKMRTKLDFLKDEVA